MNMLEAIATMKDRGERLAEGSGATWTGVTALRTVSAEDAGTDNDMELLYFQLATSGGGGDIYWVDASGMDELSDEDMQEYLSM